VSEVVFVGTSDAFGAGGRRQSAVFVRAPNGGVLIDCGTTTCSGLNELGVPREEIDTLLISHFHGDHFGGIPLLLLAALYEDGRKKPLRIAGPRGIEARVRGLSAAMGHAVEGREWSFPLHFLELPVGREIEAGPVRVRAFETHHTPDSIPHGLMIDLGKERIAYSGDTGWFDELPSHVAGSDLFICECTYHSPGFEYHLNYEQLCEHKHSFDCNRFLLSHLGNEMLSFRGDSEIETADDGLRLKL